MRLIDRCKAKAIDPGPKPGQARENSQCTTSRRPLKTQSLKQSVNAAPQHLKITATKFTTSKRQHFEVNSRSQAGSEPEPAGGRLAFISGAGVPSFKMLLYLFYFLHST